MINTKDEFESMERALKPNKAKIRYNVNKILDEFEGDDHAQLLMIIKEMIEKEMNNGK